MALGKLCAVCGINVMGYRAGRVCTTCKSRKRRAIPELWEREKVAARTKYDPKRRLSNPSLFLYYDAKKRAKKWGMVFDLTSPLLIPALCPVLGIPLVSSSGTGRARTPNSPSYDRIDSSRGYTRDNVRVISWRANQLKNEATPEETALLYADSLRIATMCR